MMNNNQIYTRYMYSYPHKTAYSNIEKINLNDYSEIFKNNDNALYFHIPFCNTKCGYCNLFSLTGKNEEYINHYMDSLEKQAMQLNIYNIKWKEFIIGGGTPLILTEKQLRLLFLIACDILEVNTKDVFSCIETSPNQTTLEKVNILKENDIKRVSIGVQSFLDSELKILNRNHFNKNIIKSLEILKKVGFPVLNIDIIYGIPTQTVKTLKYSIDSALDYSPEEIFMYPLYRRKNNTIKSNYIPDTYSLYLFGSEYLESNGYKQLSMRRFVKNTDTNLADCGFSNTISLGAGGRSYIGNTHVCLPYTNELKENTIIIDKYIEEKEKLNMDFGYVLNVDEQKRRYIIKNLLCTNGLNISDFKKIFDSDLLLEFQIFEELLKNKYCIIKNNKIILTKIGLSLSDYIGPMFISYEVAGKMNDYVLKEWIKNDSR